MPKARLHLLISGRVQGVWYRASTRKRAEKLGLTGWVRNLADGRVEALAEGHRTALEDLLRWCHSGPPLARVTDIQADWSEAKGEFHAFETRYR